MIRFLKRVFHFLLVLCILAAVGYFVVIPRVLPMEYQESVEKYAQAYDLEPALIYAVIFCESRFEPDAVSRADAKGLMQVTDDTGVWVAGQIEGMDASAIDLFDPDTNIQIGCKYLEWLFEKFDGNPKTALAGYNAGHGNVARWLADEEKSRDGISLDEIPYEETEHYVEKVELVKKLYEWIYRI